MTNTTGIGNHIPDRWRGALVFDHLPDDLQRAEDATHARDVEDRRACYDRPSTETEQMLLAHLGFSVPPTLLTHCERMTNGIVRRRWPTLESQLEEDDDL